MSEQQIAKRWAQALFNLGSTDRSWDQLLSEFEIKIKLLDDHPKFKRWLTSSKITLEAKEEMLFKIFEGRMDPKFLKFLVFLLRKRRFHYLTDIAREYSHLVKRHFGLLEARLITAVPATDEIKEQLRSKIETELKGKATLICEIDPKIMGGALVVIENRILDGSLQTKLRRLNEKLVNIHV